jgi:dipeptidyl aminopeptidase/acylaminoacyl peptidase
MSRSRIATILILSCTVGCSLSFAQEKRNITENDIYAFQWIAGAQISPDGSQVVYTQVRVTPKHDNYENFLWLIPTAGGPGRQLTSSPFDADPHWSPDGKQIAFVRTVAPARQQIYLLSMDGGEARQLTDMPRGAAAPVWSPDGKSIAFTSSTQSKDLDKKASNAPEESDVRVITKAQYRNNGAGFPEPGRPSHIWVVDVPKILNEPQKARQVTSGEFSEGDAIWSKDGKKIYFVSTHSLEPYFEPPNSALYVVNVEPPGEMPAGVITTVATVPDGSIRSIVLSPDGNRIAFIGAINPGDAPDGKVKHRSYSQPDLFVTDVKPGSTPKNLTTAYDFDIGGGIGGDQAPPRGSAGSKPYWTADGRGIVVATGEEGKGNLRRIDAATGAVTPVTDGNHDVYSYSATPDGSKLALLISTPTNIGDLFVADGNLHANRLTHINDELFSKLKLTEPETIWYKSFDGRKIEAWVQRPPDFQEGKKYPLILNIHGGPHAAYGYTFDHEFQWMAAKGYVVLYPNPRGSTTYGQDFGNIIQYHYPGDDFKDLMAGVDDLVKRGWVDSEKMGVTGGSGGGVLTNWTVGHTNRFKAAVSQRSIADWSGFWYTADFTQFTANWFRGAPWEDEADFKARSPITYIKNMNTPLMLVEGEADLRTPPADGGEQMFRALKYRHIPTVMVRFPGESHELSRSGKPTHRVERLQHIVAWMDKYVQGKEIHTYDLK